MSVDPLLAVGFIVGSAVGLAGGYTLRLLRERLR